MQLALAITPDEPDARNYRHEARPFSAQLLKWIGNKQRLASSIIPFFPSSFGTYYEPFLGAGGMLGVLQPRKAEASDSFKPLIEIWQALARNPELLKRWYLDRRNLAHIYEKPIGYEIVKSRYNQNPNGPDLLFLSRACYGGVVRFRQKDGFMSTPCGAHEPISAEAFFSRVDEWHKRTRGTTFYHRGYEESFDRAVEGDVIYCDPPYSHSQAILYGAQRFSLGDLYKNIERAKRNGVFVALSIDGSKKSGRQPCDVGIPKGLFAREIRVSVGRSMLRRFQMEGKTLEAELVSDRLLLTH